MWPHGMIWEKGEQIQLSVSGFNLRPELTWMTPAVRTCNRGKIIVHTGGRYNSHFLVPLIPQSRWDRACMSNSEGKGRK